MDRLIALSLVFCSCAFFVPAEREDGSEMIWHDPSAASVQLVGDWNLWGGLAGADGTLDPLCGRMEYSGGNWRGSFPDTLSRGRYRYAFLVNGSQFQRDMDNPQVAEFRGNPVSLLIID
jgi:hypothetical protein